MIDQTDKQLKILLLEDNIADAELLIRVLDKAKLDHEMHLVETKDHFMAELLQFKPDLVLSDHSLPNFNSMEALKVARSHRPDMPFILVTGSVSEQFAVDCMKAGVDDYILKSSLMRLPSSIRNIMSRADAHREKKMVESLHAKLKIAYEDIENIHKNITDSINYARLIQQAMLPDKALLAKNFKSSFVLYKPKDIVSGDFYWFAESGDKILLAAADCTGHGVPGALMSMVGISLLNEVVNVKHIIQPSLILDNLNTGIRRTLKQNAENQRFDGMDIALCAIDRQTGELEYAGANRHLLYFKNREMQLIKGNKFGIGGLYQGADVHYTNHRIKYEPGDIIYMFTDGYADQFGGARGKRMMTRNLFRILQRSLSFGLEEQEKVLDYWLERWQRNLEQTDDILLMGVEL